MIEKIYLYFLLTIAFMFMCDMLRNISLYFNEIRNHQYMINVKENNEESELPLTERLQSTVDMLALVSTLIDNEISKSLQSCVTLDTPYDLKRLDDDAKLIATEVFGSIKATIYQSNDMVLSEKYLMQYIADETIIKMIKITKEYNATVRRITH